MEEDIIIKAGRRSKITPDKINIAIKLAQENRTITDICKFLNINRQTFYNWGDSVPEFKERILQEKKAAEQREIEQIRKSLVKRAKGYKTKETKERFDESGNLLGYDVTTKEVPADVKAQQFYLINRDPDNWKTAPQESLFSDDSDNNISIEIDDPKTS